MQSSWLIPLAAPADAKVNVICFSFAGGSAAAFREWVPALDRTMALWGVQLPGRDNRYHEPFLTRTDAIVSALLPLVEPLLEKPTLFFGHSLGALLAYELAMSLQDSGRSGIDHLIVSGKRPPHLPPFEATFHLERDQFIAKLRSYGGTPELVLRDPELIEMFLPRLKADAQIIDTYAYRARGLLHCPILALGGDSDNLAPTADLLKWAVLGNAGFRHRVFPGHHFFIKQEAPAITAMLCEIARELACARVPPLDNLPEETSC